MVEKKTAENIALYKYKRRVQKSINLDLYVFCTNSWIYVYEFLPDEFRVVNNNNNATRHIYTNPYLGTCGVWYIAWLLASTYF